jgi:DNA repair exonuclease SbcCD ATPase subunit
MNNINIKKLSIQGFKSFADKQELDFSQLDEQGLFFVTGKNLVDINLGANGAGKSVFFSDAITWILFGKTSVNLKAGDIKNWNSKVPTKGTLKFEVNGLNYIVERCYSPNSLKLNNEVVAQEKIESIIGVNFDSFLYSVLVSQFGSKFIDYTSSQKMEVFTSILDNLPYWDKCSEKAKADKEQYEDDIELTEKEISFLSGKMSSLESKIESSKEDEKKWETSRKEKVDNLKNDWENIGKKIGKQSLLLEDRLIDLKAFSGIDETNIETLEKEIKECENKIVPSFKSKIQCESSISFYEEEIKKLSSIENEPICPTCKQVCAVEHIEKEKHILYTSIDDVKIKILEIEQDIAKDTFIKEEKNKKLSELKKQKKEDDSLLFTINDEIKSLKFEIASLEKDATNILNNIKSLKEETNPHSINFKDYIKELGVLKTEKEEYESTLLSVKELYEVTKYWVKGFREIKLMLVAEALKEFEIEINNNLQSFGMSGWEVLLDVDSENKSGTIRKGFTVMVKSPENDKLVPFEVWSGGEGQRIRLAVTLGLIDFIKNRRGFNFNILVMDEPTQHLSDEGINDLLECLKQKSDEDNIKIFFIDHKNLISSGIFSGIIEVIKDETGSKININ